MKIKALEYFNQKINDLQKLLNDKQKESAEVNNYITIYQTEIDNAKHKLKDADSVFSASSHKLKDAKHNIDEYTNLKAERTRQRDIINQEINSILEELNYIVSCRDEIENNLKFFEDEEIDFSSNAEGIDIIKVQEKERERIAADIHDTVVQQLSALAYKSELCSKVIAVDTERVKMELDIIEKLARECITELRSIIYDLHPMELNDLGLKSAILQLIEHIQNNTIDYTIQLSIPDNFKTVDSTIAMVILRNIRELCINGIKHSKGSNIYVKLFFRGEKVYLDVSDDGKGFDNSEVRDDSFGLSLIKERVQLLNGKMTISNRKEGGSSVKISLPIGV